MRTDQPSSAARAVARFRSQVAGVRRALVAQGPAFRWSLALGVLAVLVLCGYLAVPVPGGTALLRGGQRFSSGDIIKISRALDLQRINYRVDDQGRIVVAADALEEAEVILAKSDIGPRSIEELDKDSQASGFLDGPDVREQKKNKGQEQILAAMIREFDGIVSAYVTINRPRSRMGIARPGTAPGSRPTAFVWLETEGGREISHKTVQSIQNLIVGKEPELKFDAVTVFDQRGRHYLVAGDPKYSTLSATRAREEELSQRILEEIDWIDGVRVTVQLIPTPPPAPASLPLPPPSRAASATPSPSARVPERTMSVNMPLALEPEPETEPQPEPQPVPEAAPAAPSSPLPVASASSLPEWSAPKNEVARVWVRVPLSYYYSKAGPDRDPSPDRLQPIEKRTEELIRVAVERVLPPELTPPGEPPDLKIDRIPDREALGAPLRAQVISDTRRPLSWWLPAAGGGLLVLLSALGVGLLAWRRPSPGLRTIAAPRPGRFRSDAASEASPGPAERVRELIRRNPEAAAGVLHRWIGQGEALP